MNRFILMMTAMSLFLLSLATVASAQQTKADLQQSITDKPQPEADATVTDTQDSEREQKLAEYLNGIKLIGKFTIDGRDNADPKTEEYTISKCEKLDQPDMYRLTARIVYGEVDAEVPLDLKILWSGNTPVITMDAFWIPGMGTFDARVMLHKGRYAGTWQHDAVGGHMYGVLRKVESEEGEKLKTEN